VAVQEAARAQCEGRCHLTGEMVAYGDFAAAVPRTLIESMGVSLILVSAVVAYLALALGQFRLTPVILLTAFWGTFLTLDLVAVLGIPLDFLKCVVASVLVGLTGDNAIQYLFASRGKGFGAGIERRGGASVQTAFFMAGTALFYLGSRFSPPKTFGLILAFGLVASLVGDLWLLNALRPRDPRPSGK
jgi:uncharacterized protein